MCRLQEQQQQQSQTRKQRTSAFAALFARSCSRSPSPLLPPSSASVLYLTRGSPGSVWLLFCFSLNGEMLRQQRKTRRDASAREIACRQTVQGSSHLLPSASNLCALIPSQGDLPSMKNDRDNVCLIDGKTIILTICSSRVRGSLHVRARAVSSRRPDAMSGECLLPLIARIEMITSFLSSSGIKVRDATSLSRLEHSQQHRS